jgi:HK97 family phage prohead protease
MPDFILATENVNRYGYRLIMAGAQLDNFLANPIMLYMHRRSGERFPVGKWDNLRVEGDKLIGTPNFDVEDKMGAEIKRKVEAGYLNATSVGFDRVSVSENPDMMLTGQYRATVTEWELLEVSFVDIPGDPKAVRLNLCEGESIDDILPKLNFQNDMSKQNFSLVLVALGLALDATDEQATAAINQLKADRADALLAFGESKGVVNDANKATYQKLATSDFGTTMELIKATDGPDDTGDQGGGSTDTAQQEGLVKQLLAAANKGTLKVGADGEKDDRAAWTFDDYQKKDPKALNELRLKDATKYEQLAVAYANS